MELTEVLGWVCLALGALGVLGGFAMSIQHANATPPERAAGPIEQGAVVDVIKSTTDFAKAVKDLDLGGRLMIVGVLLIAVAALAAGLDQVAEAVTEVANAQQ